MQFAFQEELQQLFQPGGFRHVDELARRSHEVCGAHGLETHGEKVFEMDDAEGLVEVALFAKGEARKASFFGHIEAFREAGLGAQSHNFLPGPHHIADAAATQVQRIQNNVVPQTGSSDPLLRGGEEQAQFFLGMGHIRFAGRLDAQALQQPLRGKIQHPNEGIREPIKPNQRLCDPERRRERLANGQRFGRQFPDDHQQEGVSDETNRNGDGVPHPRGLDLQPREYRREQGLEDRFDQDSKAEARQCNA